MDTPHQPSNISPDQKPYFEEVDGYVNAFFARAERCFDLIFNDKDKNEIIYQATHALGKHCVTHNVEAKTLCGYKLTSFLGYFAAQNVKSRVQLNSVDSIMEVCEACISKLADLMLQESESCQHAHSYNLSPTDREYFVKLLFSEINQTDPDVGVGPNGIALTFAYSIRAIRFQADKAKDLVEAA